jgi:hypothetical protein
LCTNHAGQFFYSQEIKAQDGEATNRIIEETPHKKMGFDVRRSKELDEETVQQKWLLLLLLSSMLFVIFILIWPILK